MSNEQFDQVKASLLSYYHNAEIDYDCFIITNEDLSEGDLLKKGIPKLANDHLHKFNSFFILVK